MECLRCEDSCTLLSFSIHLLLNSAVLAPPGGASVCCSGETTHVCRSVTAEASCKDERPPHLEVMIACGFYS